MVDEQLSHLNEQNRPKMVDVSPKNITKRIATASGKIKMSKEAYQIVIQNKNKKGPVLNTAIIAAIMGAKKTSELIPMCHPLFLSSINCDINELEKLPGFEVIVTTKVESKTGVEMEALSGVSIGLLTIYDMVKAIDKHMQIFDIKLMQKSGGKSDFKEVSV